MRKEMDKLKPINKADLIFENEPLKDRINTKLTLSDNDWMQYIIETEFSIMNQGVLKVKFEYNGIHETEMTVERENGKKQEYRYWFASGIFEKYLRQYMKEHLKQWECETVFYGGDIVLNLYNEVLRCGQIE